MALLRKTLRLPTVCQICRGLLISRRRERIDGKPFICASILISSIYWVWHISLYLSSSDEHELLKTNWFILVSNLVFQNVSFVKAKWCRWENVPFNRTMKKSWDLHRTSIYTKDSNMHKTPNFVECGNISLRVFEIQKVTAPVYTFIILIIYLSNEVFFHKLYT